VNHLGGHSLTRNKSWLPPASSNSSEIPVGRDEDTRHGPEHDLVNVPGTRRGTEGSIGSRPVVRPHTSMPRPLRSPQMNAVAIDETTRKIPSRHMPQIRDAVLEFEAHPLEATSERGGNIAILEPLDVTSVIISPLC
jgi:hypothetical protein